MFTSIPGESPNPQDEETDEMIDHIDKNSDEDSQSPSPKKKEIRRNQMETSKV